jgi:phosphoribosylformylglycinamidine cyclo-ligase
MASSGLHSNGYSLVRRVLDVAGWQLDRPVDELGRVLGEELLEPTRVYALDVLDLARAGRGDGVDGGIDVHAVSHVTGGGLAANLARVLPRGLEAVVDRSTWTPAPVFGLVRRLGAVPLDDLERTLNLGVGMVAIVAAEGADAAVRRLAARGVPAWVLGEVRDARPDDASGDLTQGAKGVDGGAVRMVGRQDV